MVEIKCPSCGTVNGPKKIDDEDHDKPAYSHWFCFNCGAALMDDDKLEGYINIRVYVDEFLDQEDDWECPEKTPAIEVFGFKNPQSRFIEMFPGQFMSTKEFIQHLGIEKPTREQRALLYLLAETQNGNLMRYLKEKENVAK